MTTLSERRRHLAAELVLADESSPGTREAVMAAAGRIEALVRAGWGLDKATACVQAQSRLEPGAWRLVTFVCAEGATGFFTSDL